MPFTRSLFITVSAACFFPLTALGQDAPPPAPPAAAIAAPPAAAIAAPPGLPPAPAVAAPAAPAVAPGMPAPAAKLMPVSANTPVTHDEFPELLKKTLLDHPEIIMEAAQKMRDKQIEESKKQAKESLEKRKAELFGDTESPSIGDPKTADVTLVEFFDYHCGYCKHLLPAITQLSNEDKKVRIIFREFPILSEDSVTAARAALAVNRIAKDKYFEFHTMLMKMDGKFDEKTLLDAAKKLGISSEKLKAEMGKQDITAMLDKNRELAEDLGIRGTPAVIIGDQLLPGAMPYEDLKKLVDEERNGKKDDAPAPAAASPAPAAPAAVVPPPPAAAAPAIPPAPAKPE